MEYRIMLIVFLLTMQCVSAMFPEKSCIYVHDLIASCISKQGNNYI